jgi:peroxiredoxin
MNLNINCLIFRIMRKLKFRKKFCCSITACLSLFAVCSNSLYAANESGSGDLPIVVNDSQQDAKELKAGVKAPDFTLTSIKGESVKLSDFSSQVVVLYFWASSAPESRRITADIARLEKQYKNADLSFVGVSLDVNKAAWQAAVNSDGLTGPQLSELKNLENADIAKLYGVDAIPAVYIIDPDGVLISIDNAAVDLSQKLKDIFGR